MNTKPSILIRNSRAVLLIFSVLPAKTQAPTLSFIGENFINISWPRTDPGDSKVTSYSIFYRDKKSGKNNTKVVASGSGSTNISTQLNGLQPFTPYMVQVRAVSAIGSGDLSDKTTFVTHRKFYLN